ncbi:MAG: hypothetical protein BJ554DRAFT_6387 [Olpidium bornovanus]|uniref:Uncharacterized protein n=1 Tax=Olpidium bornovanus TaxID=278681 RepID=A0A8H7ZXU8_9FUNG|nr:MAG: hypothetical protein BJ554DRAFT_6387 [Olpidium bornovanus]
MTDQTPLASAGSLPSTAPRNAWELQSPEADTCEGREIEEFRSRLTDAVQAAVLGGLVEVLFEGRAGDN